VTSLRPLAVLALVVALSGAGCSGGGDSTTDSAATGAQTTTVPSGQVSHAAPDLEALLPAKVKGTSLRKGSTTGAVVFGGDAFSREMTRRLAAAGKVPADLRFANAQDPRGRVGLEVGVFEVAGMSAAALRRAIVASSRPNAPGLRVESSALGGKRVTRVTYPGGTLLYLYEQGGRVFYVGTQNDALAAGAIGLLP
jgi:hypothetical protein